MATFTDRQAREWSIDIDALLIERIRQDYDPKFLLDEGAKVATAERMAADPVLLAHATYLACEKQRNERNLNLEDFYRQVLGSGETQEAIGDAWELAFANFTHPKKRAFIAAVANKRREVEVKGMELAMARINDPTLVEKAVAAMGAKMDALLEQALTQLGSATNSPDSSESTRED